MFFFFLNHKFVRIYALCLFQAQNKSNMLHFMCIPIHIQKSVWAFSSWLFLCIHLETVYCFLSFVLQMGTPVTSSSTTSSNSELSAPSKALFPSTAQVRRKLQLKIALPINPLNRYVHFKNLPKHCQIIVVSWLCLVVQRNLRIHA